MMRENDMAGSRELERARLSKVKDRPPRLSILAGIIGAPGLWAGQLIANFCLVNFVCGHQGGGARAAAWPIAVYIINGLAVIGAAFAFILAIGAFRRSRAGAHGLTVNAQEGRKHFLSIWALAFAFAFTVSILFNSASLFMPRACP